MAKFAEKGTKRSIEELYDAIFAIREALQDAMQLASEAVNIADSFGGEISRVITAQLNQYFIPILAKYLDDENTPGAIAPLVAFLDSVPLAMTRQPSEPQQTAPAPIKTELATPPSPAPAEGSYAAKTQQTQESKKSAAKKLTENQYTVVRRLDKMDDDIVFTGTKEEAERKADWLNKSLTNSEIDDLDVEYVVKPLELKAQKDVSKPTGLPKVKESSDSDDDEPPDWYEEDDGEYSLPDECLYCRTPSVEFEEIEGDEDEEELEEAQVKAIYAQQSQKESLKPYLQQIEKAYVMAKHLSEKGYSVYKIQEYLQQQFPELDEDSIGDVIAACKKI